MEGLVPELVSTAAGRRGDGHSEGAPQPRQRWWERKKYSSGVDGGHCGWGPREIHYIERDRVKERLDK